MSIIPLQNPHNKKSEVTNAKVTKRFVPSPVWKRPPAGLLDDLDGRVEII
jgi:hypothetical protein